MLSASSAASMTMMMIQRGKALAVTNFHKINLLSRMDIMMSPDMPIADNSNGNGNGNNDNDNTNSTDTSSGNGTPNSADSTPTNGKLTPTQPINFNTLKHINGRAVKSCYLKIRVKDTGIGMTKDEQARIFRRFSQANSRTSSVIPPPPQNHSSNCSQEYGGSGLGLSICKILSKLMDGYLYVESTKTEGSTFYLSVHCKQYREEAPPEPRKYVLFLFYSSCSVLFTSIAQIALICKIALI